MRRLVLAAVLVVAASAAAQEGPVKRPGPGGAAAPDSSSIVVDHGRSVLQELRERGGKADDFPTAFKSEKIGTGQVPVKTVERFAVEGAPLLYFTKDLSAVVVDARRAGDLKRVDATRLRKGERAVVGSLRPETVAALGLRDVALLLIHAGVVGTYWHIGATLRLEAERAGELDVAGTHEYFTNERNEAPVAFTVAVSKEGQVTIIGR